MMDDKDLAEIMYRDYRDALGDDAPEKPIWDDLSDDERARWVYVAEMVREPVLNEAESEMLGDINALEDTLEDHRDALWQVLEVIKPILNLKVLDELV